MTTLDDHEREQIEKLILRLVETPILSKDSISDQCEAFQNDRMNNVFGDGLSWGEASGDLPIYSLNQDNFFANIRATNDDIIMQIERFNFGLDRWFKLGETHPPYFPWRIIIILSKRREFEIEIRFLSAYCKHFYDGARRGSRTDERIVERAIKKGAWDYWPRKNES